MTPDQCIEEVRKLIEASKLKGIVVTIEGSAIKYRYIGMGAGETIDRMADVRASVMEQIKCALPEGK